MNETDYEIIQIKTPKRILLDYGQKFGFIAEHNGEESPVYTVNRNLRTVLK